MKTKKGWLCTLVLTMTLAACATTGTRVTSSSDTFKSMASGQKTWCEMFGGCTCYIDGIQTTCSLVFACLNSGNCKLAER